MTKCRDCARAVHLADDDPRRDDPPAEVVCEECETRRMVRWRRAERRDD